MAHGLRGFALLIAAGSVGCTSTEKITPQRISMPPLPPPNLQASPTAATKPASPVPDNRGLPRPAAATPPAVSETPMPGQVTPFLPPAAATPNPSTMPLSPGDSKVPGRGAPSIPTPSPAPPTAVNPILYNQPEPGAPPAVVPAPPPIGKPIEVPPPLPPAK